MSKKTRRKLKVLVTGAGSCGVGEGIIKALNLAKRYEIYAAEINPLSPMLFRIKKGFIVPRAEDSKYIEKLLSICEKEKIAALIPGSDPEMVRLIDAISLFKEQGTELILNSHSVVKICSDDWLLYKFLRANNFNIPETWLFKDRHKVKNFPVVIKPRGGPGGSKNVFFAEDKRELSFYTAYLKKRGIEGIIQQYVGDMEHEYTVGVTTGRDNQVLGCIGMRRALLGGASGRVWVDVNGCKEVEDYAERVAESLGAIYTINIQFRIVNGKIYIIEINPRFSGTTPIRAVLGINEPDIVLRHYILNEKVDRQYYVKKYWCARVFQEVFIEDDFVKKLSENKSIKAKSFLQDYI